MKDQKILFPRVGQRILRSVAAVVLSFVVYTLRGHQGIPFYTTLAVLQCMQPYHESTWKVARKRTTGTLIGAFWGLVLILLQVELLQGRFQDTMPGYLLISFFTGIVLYSTVLLGVKETAYFSCVVFLSITVIHLGDERPFRFVFNRVLDTMIGVVLALFVNSVHLPRIRDNRTLYVSGIDDTILDKASSLSPYSKIELNRMIDEGLQFTVSTIRTPASVREALEGVRLNIPIIAMDGAVLYDMQENLYLMKYQMSPQEAKRMTDFAGKHHIQVFTNTVTDNLLVIYYRILDNEAQQGIYQRRRRSPYRNYVHTEQDVYENVVYLLLIDRTEKMEAFYEELMREPWIGSYRIEKALSENYPGFTHIKVYHRDATRTHMLENLKALKELESSVTFGSIPGKYDVLITDSGKDSMVRQLKKLYKPTGIQKKKRSEHYGKVI